MIPNTLTLQHERVDDIPLLLGLMQQLQLPETLERALGSHHLHQGISNGWLACVWMAFILSEANHRKVSVQDWAQSHHHTLAAIIGMCPLTKSASPGAAPLYGTCTMSGRPARCLNSSPHRCDDVPVPAEP